MAASFSSSPPSVLWFLGSWCSCVFSLVSLQVQTPGCFLLVDWVWEFSLLFMSRSGLSGNYLLEGQSYKLLGVRSPWKRQELC